MPTNAIEWSMLIYRYSMVVAAVLTVPPVLYYGIRCARKYLKRSNHG